MTDVRGPSDTKSSPVDSTSGPWMRVGYEDMLNTVIPFDTFITYSTITASNYLVSEKGTESTKSDALVDEDDSVRLWRTPCVNTD